MSPNQSSSKGSLQVLAGAHYDQQIHGQYHSLTGEIDRSSPCMTSNLDQFAWFPMSTNGVHLQPVTYST